MTAGMSDDGNSCTKYTVSEGASAEGPPQAQPPGAAAAPVGTSAWLDKPKPDSNPRPAGMSVRLEPLAQAPAQPGPVDQALPVPGSVPAAADAAPGAPPGAGIPVQCARPGQLRTMTKTRSRTMTTSKARMLNTRGVRE